MRSISSSACVELVAETDERDIRVLVRRQRADLGDVRRACDHVVAEAGDELGDECDPVLPLVRDQDAQGLVRHSLLLSGTSTQACRGFLARTW